MPRETKVLQGTGKVAPESVSGYRAPITVHDAYYYYGYGRKFYPETFAYR